MKTVNVLDVRGLEHEERENMDAKTLGEMEQELIREGVLFPILERHDVVEPPSIMKMEHMEFRQKKKELFQIALQVLAPQEWEDVKKENDKIGYCCFTPEDVHT